MKVINVNQSGTYTFSLPVGCLAIIITFKGIYPHYSGSTGIVANQLVNKNENVITSVNNSQRTVSVYNVEDGATQAVILMPR